MSKKRIWYHCTTDDKGRLWTAQNYYPEIMDRREPQTPRLCVCQYVPDCLASRMFAQGLPIYVYATQEPRGSNPPKNVWDAGITGEVWLVPPVPMERVGIISADQAEAAQGYARWYHQTTRQASGAYQRLAQLLQAWEVLGTTWHPKAKKWPTGVRYAWLRHVNKPIDQYWLDITLAALEGTDNATAPQTPTGVEVT